MAEDGITALKETLRNQLLIMKRLYTELEEEREASASGADEALSMILRLQKEKAEEKMEACQYKQMAEAKLHHAEESLAMLEQVICQKDIEIASLKNQVQAYKQMLLSAGITNVDVKKLNDLWFSCGASLDRRSSCVQVRRQTSLPSVRFSKLCSEIAISEADGFLLPALQSIWRGIGDCQSQLTEHQRQCVTEKSVVKESSSFVRQIQEVNTSVDQLLHTQSVEQKSDSRTISANNRCPQSFEEESTPSSWHSATGADMLIRPRLEADSTGNKIQYISTQEMLEIPISNSKCLLRKSSKKVLREPHPEAEQMIGIPESMPEETACCSLGDDVFANMRFKLSQLRKGTSINYQPKFVEPGVRDDSFQTDLKQLKCQIQQLADDISIMKQEELQKGKEQLRFLRKVHEQLNPDQSQVKSSRSKKSFQQDEALFVFLTEAILSCSI